MSTTVYSQVLIYTAELTGASMERTKMPNLRHGSKGGFEPGLIWLRVRHSTAELPRSICFFVCLSVCMFVCLSVSPSISLLCFGHPITLCRLTHCQYNESVWYFIQVYFCKATDSMQYRPTNANQDVSNTKPLRLCFWQTRLIRGRELMHGQSYTRQW